MRRILRLTFWRPRCFNSQAKGPVHGQRFPTANEEEQATLFRVLTALRMGDQKSTGKLDTELFPGSEMSRDVFEDVLGAMARAGVAQLSDAVFEKDGKQIPYLRCDSLRPVERRTKRRQSISS
jgi:hypothetical protein